MIVKLNLHGTEIVIDDLTTDEASALISNLIKNIDDNGNEQGEATLTVDEANVNKSFECAAPKVPGSDFTVSTDTDDFYEFDANDSVFDLSNIKFRFSGTTVPNEATNGDSTYDY
jgi:hypothetical protein